MIKPRMLSPWLYPPQQEVRLIDLDSFVFSDLLTFTYIFEYKSASAFKIYTISMGTGDTCLF